MRQFAVGSLSAEIETAIGLHIDECSICQDVLSKVDSRATPLLSSIRLSDQDSSNLVNRLKELKSESVPERNQTKATRTLDLQPWLEKTSDEFGRQMVDEFELRDCIGRGGMGIVYRAFDTKLHRDVALKFMSPNLLASENSKERFFREAQAAAAITHVNVVSVYAVNQFDELPFLVMELVAGETLEHLIESGRLPFEQVVAIGKQIALGLAAAHSVGVQHRDIKPTNILMDGNVAKLSDFGLARVAASSFQTGTETLVGTPDYIAPERIEPELGPSDQRSDLFSLGAVLYTMATGKSPFRSESVLGTLKSICSTAPEPVTDLAPEVPKWFDQLLRRLLAKRPEDRIQGASDVLHILEQQEIAKERVNPLQRPGPLLAGLGCILLAAGGFWAAYGWSSGDSAAQGVAKSSDAPIEATRSEQNAASVSAFVRVDDEEELLELLQDTSRSDLRIELATDELRLPMIELEQRDVTIVAAAGFHPTIFFSMNDRGIGLSATETSLALQGISIESDSDTDDEPELDEWEALIVLDGGSLLMRDSSIEHHGLNPCIMISEMSARFDSCNILAPNTTAVQWQPSEEHQLEMIQNVVVSEIQIDFIEPFGKTTLLRGNTFIGRTCFECGNEGAEHSLSLVTENNTFVSSNALLLAYCDSEADNSLDWIFWRSTGDVLPIPLIQQVTDSDDDRGIKRAWALSESLRVFEGITIQNSTQETGFNGISSGEIEAKVLDGELTPSVIRRLGSRRK
ncbi:MAG: hypothetical protein Aurels2KO_14320 [Aureliella sp.]